MRYQLVASVDNKWATANQTWSVMIHITNIIIIPIRVIMIDLTWNSSTTTRHSTWAVSTKQRRWQVLLWRLEEEIQEGEEIQMKI